MQAGAETPAFNVALGTFEDYPEQHFDFSIDKDGFIRRSTGIAAGQRVQCRVCCMPIQEILGWRGRWVQPVIIRDWGPWDHVPGWKYLWVMQHDNCTPDDGCGYDSYDSDGEECSPQD